MAEGDLNFLTTQGKDAARQLQESKGLQLLYSHI